MNRRYRKTVIAGNWKMNKTPAEAKALHRGDEAAAFQDASGVRWFFACRLPIFRLAVKAAKGSKIAIGAENMPF